MKAYNGIEPMRASATAALPRGHSPKTISTKETMSSGRPTLLIAFTHPGFDEDCSIPAMEPAVASRAAGDGGDKHPTTAQDGSCASQPVGGLTGPLHQTVSHALMVPLDL